MSSENQKKSVNVRYMTMTAMLSAIAFVLMMLEFSVPVMPFFIKLDFSELPALIGSFSMGPLSGVAICLIKNLLHLPMSSTGGVGELSNFILGALFVVPAGLMYKKKKGRKSALIGSFMGAVIMALVSVVSNYFIVYPVYTAIMPIEAIISAYQAIFPKADTLLKCLVYF
ncbi:MAG: ECF transporter S component, partial [Lachnospiraceae bacterium]